MKTEVNFRNVKFLCKVGVKESKNITKAKHFTTGLLEKLCK